MANVRSESDFDYVIVGGGTAGCVLAGRLSEDPDVRVLVIEAGPWDRHPFIKIPSGPGKLAARTYQWEFTSTPQTACGGRVLPLAQGKVIGGGGSINAQVFTRGVPNDYDEWATTHGCKGWAFEDIQRFFLRSEGNERLSGPWHGTNGPLSVSDLAQPHPMSKAFVQAAQEFGLPYNADFNGAQQFGVGFYQTTTRRARRCSSAAAYLHPVLKRKNLVVKTRHLSCRIVLDGRRAVAVETLHRGGRSRFTAEREVLLSAGALNSPKLLQLSGIGDPEELKAAGIQVRHPLVGVGKNLHDHCAVEIIYELKEFQSMDRLGRVRLDTGIAALQYFTFRSGPLASTGVEAGGFSYANREDPSPDLQFHFLPAAYVEAGMAPIRRGYGVALNSYFLRPRSRGSVCIVSDDPRRQPAINPNFVADDYDLEMSTEGLRQCREIMAQPSIAKHVRQEHLTEGRQLKSKDDCVAFVRDFGRTGFHPVGTCAMGDADHSVVATDLRVHGIDGLRVVDSSIMPRLVSSNTQAVTVMIAEKASDLIRKAEEYTERPPTRGRRR